LLDSIDLFRFLQILGSFCVTLFPRCAAELGSKNGSKLFPPLPPLPTHHGRWKIQPACFVVRDHNGQQLAFEDEPGRRSAVKLLTRGRIVFLKRDNLSDCRTPARGLRILFCAEPSFAWLTHLYAVVIKLTGPKVNSLALAIDVSLDDAL
jgi:hypothetical protein